VRECAAYRHLQVSPVAGALGAEVQGVDLARPLAGRPAAVSEATTVRPGLWGVHSSWGCARRGRCDGQSSTILNSVFVHPWAPPRVADSSRLCAAEPGDDRPPGLPGTVDRV